MVIQRISTGFLQLSPLLPELRDPQNRNRSTRLPGFFGRVVFLQHVAKSGSGFMNYAFHRLALRTRSGTKSAEQPLGHLAVGSCPLYKSPDVKKLIGETHVDRDISVL